jgi:hypothetical protein
VATPGTEVFRASLPPYGGDCEVDIRNSFKTLEKHLFRYTPHVVIFLLNTTVFCFICDSTESRARDP